MSDTGSFQGLRTVIYHAPDLAKTKAWYAKVLGIEPYFDQPFYVGFNVAGYELGLDPDSSSTPGGEAGGVAYWGVAGAAGGVWRLGEIWGAGRSAVEGMGGGGWGCQGFDSFWKI